MKKTCHKVLVFKTALAIAAFILLNTANLTAEDDNNPGIEGVGRWSKKEVEQQMRQIRYQKRAENWAEETNAARADFLKRYFEPIVEGNRESFDDNMRMAKKLRSSAKRAKTQGRNEKAVQYRRVAKMYYQCARQNKAIVQAIVKGKDNQMLEDAFSELQGLEKKIARITGSWPEREWFTPDELQKTQAKIRAMRSARSKD